VEPHELLVSVVVPVYNGDKFIGEAIASLRRQGHPNLEIIVVDDGSTDGTADVVAQAAGPDLHYIRQANSGPPAARNTGVRAARGAVLGFLDADDLWTDDKLALLLPRLMSDPEVDIVYGRTQIMVQSGNTGGKLMFTPYQEPKAALTLQGGLFRSAVFQRVGLFDPEQRYADDVEWFLRAQDRGLKIVSYPEVTWYYRRHGQNITNQVGDHQDFLAVLIKKSLNRRRELAARNQRGPVPDSGS
jgi:glycosyltransferase involved in cell wall biosynthesis